MDVFAWFRRGQAADQADAAVTAAVADRPQEAAEQEAAGARAGSGSTENPADAVGIPKQQSADGAADSENGESARD